MLKTLGDLFRSDEFVPNSAIFPDIDKERLVKDLNLAEEGTRSGLANQPEPGAQSLDHFELKAVGRIEELRRRGLENYETNRRVYSERLNQAVSARVLVETDANDSDLSPEFPPVLRGVLGVKSLALGRDLVHRLSLQKFHWCQVSQC